MATILQQLRALTPPRGLSYVDALSVAERQALRLLQLLMLDGPLVPEEALTGLPRLRVERISPLPASGATQWIHGRWVILLNGAEAPVRQRFSLAHELKHVIDHERIKVLYPDSGGMSGHERAEQVCDYFAGCLLMPRPWLKRAWTSGLQDLGQLSRQFGVSRQAMQVRLLQTGLMEPPRRCGTRFRAPAGIAAFAPYQRQLPVAA
jgi:hypothetical protein